MLTLVTEKRDCLQLSVHPTSAFLARMHVRRTLLGWRREDSTDTAELLASELVTNALRAGGDLAQSHEQALLSPDIVTLSLYRAGPDIAIEVWDSNRTPPQQKNPGTD